jgi:hypothetical protein
VHAWQLPRGLCRRRNVFSGAAGGGYQCSGVIFAAGELCWFLCVAFGGNRTLADGSGGSARGPSRASSSSSSTPRQATSPSARRSHSPTGRTFIETTRGRKSWGLLGGLCVVSLFYGPVIGCLHPAGAAARSIGSDVGGPPAPSREIGPTSSWLPVAQSGAPPGRRRGCSTVRSLGSGPASFSTAGAAAEDAPATPSRPCP